LNIEANFWLAVSNLCTKVILKSKEVQASWIQHFLSYWMIRPTQLMLGILSMRRRRSHFLLGLMVLNATFNNISVILSCSVLLVEETGGPGENNRPVTSHWQTLSHYVVHLALIEIRTHNFSCDRHWMHR
jgi:hypothetical protein